MCRGGKNIRLGSGYEKIKYGSSSGWSVLKTKTTETFCFKNIVSFNYQDQSLLKQRQDDLFAWFAAVTLLQARRFEKYRFVRRQQMPESSANPKNTTSVKKTFFKLKKFKLFLMPSQGRAFCLWQTVKTFWGNNKTVLTCFSRIKLGLHTNMQYNIVRNCGRHDRQ